MDRSYRIWPHYLDCTASRGSGRKVPRTLCLDRPSIDLILDVCRALNLRCQRIEGKKHPRHWFRYTGLVAVEYSGRKGELIKLIARSARERHRLR
ncbi:MAG: hypothetical protein N3D82_03345 [Ignisphaera sp.]|nr:hypothetical protein [Ignisphaera sp.]MCX8168045.1 hypothetical protein [Ignisphaera sp.]MDW8085766.1 signal recognition particle subunit SRP19/SEC65 family protein [Ignisphaera sp.]